MGPREVSRGCRACLALWFLQSCQESAVALCPPQVGLRAYRDKADMSLTTCRCWALGPMAASVHNTGTILALTRALPK